MISMTQLVHRVSRAGGRDLAGAERACHAVAEALGRCLTNRTELAACVPPELRESLLRRPLDVNFDRARLYEAVAWALEIPIGQALEQTQVVCASLGALWPDAGWHQIASGLPADVAALFEPPAIADAPATSHGPRRTLAVGAPGSGHPVSSSSTSNRHRHSVAEKNPHGTTKISSGHVHDTPEPSG